MRLVHQIKPQAICIAEDMSGYPGLATPQEKGGLGFDYRLAMGVTDYWFKLLDIRDEDWNMFALWHELSQGRREEKTISYVESHDQSLVGGKTFIFTIIDSDMYWNMDYSSRTLRVDRGVALHKMARLITLAASRFGYLNFMGSEFGHPEWIDFPRQGNDWSYHHSRRLWSLAFREDLLYKGLYEFDRAIHELSSKEKFLSHQIDWLHIFDNDKIIAFRRGKLLFIFNFHPSIARTDYAIPAEEGEYELLLSSDEERFSGYGQLSMEQSYHSQVREGLNYAQVLCYLPPRLAIVLRAK